MKEPEGIIFVVIQAPISNLKPCSAGACHTDDKRLLPGKFHPRLVALGFRVWETFRVLGLGFRSLSGFQV